MIRDGRILDVLPHRAAAERYAPRIELDRPDHLAMPGLVNARSRIGAADARSESFSADGALLGIANMLKAGITCFCDAGYFPRDVAAVAVQQGLRAVIGLPVAEQSSAWAQSPGEYLTRALKLHDEYKAIRRSRPDSPRFAPAFSATIRSRASRSWPAELDAGLLVSLHESREDVEVSIRLRGERPLQRFMNLGLLGPASAASHLTEVDAGDLELLRRSGAAVTLCLASGLMRGHGVPPIDALAAPPVRVSLGSDAEHCGPGQDLWTEIKLMALHSPGASPGSVLGAATRGGAAALGLESETGTLEPGKWADVCCLDLSGPATQPPADPMRRLVFAGGRDLVSDVWVAGRQLLVEGRFTRLDWPELASRLDARNPPATRPIDTMETRP